MTTTRNDNTNNPPASTVATPPAGQSAPNATPKKPRRALYRAGRSSVSPAARERSAQVDD